MRNNQRDSVLVIRAKDEAQSTIKSINKALVDLLENFRAGGGQASDFTKGMVAIDKVMGQLSDRAESAESAFKRVNDAIGAKRGDVQNVTQQLLAATEALAKFNAQSRAADRKSDSFIGPLNFGPQVKAAEAAIAVLEKQQSRLVTDIAKMEAGIQGGASSLQIMGSAATGLEAKIAGARAEIEQTTRAMAAQAAQARMAGEMVGRINSVTGVGQRPATASGASFAALAEREIGIQKEREAAARSAAEAVRSSAEAAAGVSRPSAVTNGATFSALAAQEETKALREAAIAHDLFEKHVREGVAAMRDEEVAIKRVRDQLNPIAALEAAAAAEMQKLVQWEKQGKITAEEMAAAEKLLNDQLARSKDRASKPGGISSLLGLAPHEMQNLSYQINDIFTQLGSGASITQALAQQGGQIIQIFPKAGAAIAGAFTSPPVLAFAAAVASVVAGLARLNNERDRLRTFQGALDASATGAQYQAAALADAAKALDRYGMSADEAVKIVRTFVSAGLPQARIEQFGHTAKDLADVLGIDIVDAAKQLSEGFDGTYHGIKRLDDVTNLLSESERQRVRLLFDLGKAQDAMAVAYDAMAARLEKGAQDMRGPWADSARALGNSWSGFLDKLSNSSIVTEMAEALTDLANGVTRTLNSLSGNTTIRDIDTQIAELQRHITALRDPKTVGYFLRDKQIDDALAKIKVLQTQRAKLAAQDVSATDQSAAGKRPGTGSDTTTAGFGKNSTHAKGANDQLDPLRQQADLEALREKAQNGLAAADTQRRIELAGQLAYNQEIEASGDKQLATERRRLAVEKERSQALQQNDAAAKRAAAEREHHINLFQSRVVGAEGGTAKNPHSSAAGYGQFTTGTYLEQFRKTYGGDTGMSDDAILATRQNAAIAKAVLDTYTRENAKFLERFGAQVTAGNLYLTHFLGRGDARKILNATPGTRVDHLLSPKVINGNKGYLRNKDGSAKSVGELRALLAQRIGDTGAAQSTGQVAIQQYQKEQEDSQAALNDQIDQGNRALQQRTSELNTQSRLHGDILLQAQAQAAADEAERKLRDDVEKQNAQRLKDGRQILDLTQAQIDATRQAASDAVKTAPNRAAARREDVMQPVSDLTAQRDAIQQQIELQKAMGNGDAVKRMQDGLKDVNAQLAEAITKAQAFFANPDNSGLLEALGYTDTQIQNIIIGLDNAKLGAQQWVTLMGISGQQMAQTFASGASSGIDKFAQSVANGRNAFASLGDAVRSFVADFLVQMSRAIVQQKIFNAISSLMKIGSSVGGSAAGSLGGSANGIGAVGGLQAHDGGIIGGAGPVSRAFNPAWLATARRYHGGGIAGLAPGEIPTVLMQGEEVLTRDDPRHILNGGMSSPAPSTPQDIKIVNAIDSSHMMSEALNTTKGQRAFVNFIRQNSRAVNSALKV